MDQIINKLAFDLGISYKDIEKIYNGYWLFVKTKMQEIPFDRDYTEEEYKNMKTSFNIANLGKFHCKYDRYKKIRTQQKKKKDA